MFAIKNGILWNLGLVLLLLILFGKVRAESLLLALLLLLRL